jgi:putative serine protease PepD
VQGEDHHGFDAPGDEDDAGDDGPMRGWVPPDDRLWHHPSERAAAAAGAAPRTGLGPTAPPPRGTWMVGGLTFCVVVALVLSGMVAASAHDAGHTVVTTAAYTGVPTTEVDLSHLTTPRRMVMVASTAQESTVALVVDTGHGTKVGTGVVAEAGGIVVALLPTLAGARSVTVVEHDGTRQPAVRVGTDRATGIVVLRTVDDLPVASFTTGDPATGSLGVAMSEEDRSTGGVPMTRLYGGIVLSSGTTALPGSPDGLSVTVIAAPLTVDDLGCPLVEPSGAVAGVFAATGGTGMSRTAIFLPAELVRDVAAQIVSHGTVDHGILGAVVVDTPATTTGTTGTGALVADVVDAGSAAGAGLQRGDRIVAVDGAEVRSVAELATRLYADPPGTELPVTFVRSGATVSTTAVLTDS